MIRRYSELKHLKTFKERYNYLRLGGIVGQDTFGFNRYLNQAFYTSKEWKTIRDYVISRDLGCDLGVEGFEIYCKPVIHHMNPITQEDILHRNKSILDPEYLITTVARTHNAIHYGDENLLVIAPNERRKYDTCLWKY